LANLVLKRFQCVEDTSEIGGESPYFITWVGDITTGQSALRLTRKTYWDNNVSKGPGAWPVDDTICSGFSLKPSDTLALALMIEKDEGIDIVSSEVSSIGSTMSSALQTHRQAGFTAGNANFINTMKNTLESKVKQALSSAAGADDDLMKEDDYRAARRIVLGGKKEELAIVTFKGGGGKYNVRYAQA
jgi:hypothetical protein